MLFNRCQASSLGLLFVLVLDDAQVPGHGLNVAVDFLLDEVKAHGQQGDAE